jgi:hypothetical protein
MSDGPENLLCQIVGIGVLQSPPARQPDHIWPINGEKIKPRSRIQRIFDPQNQAFVRFWPLVHRESSVSTTQHPSLSFQKFFWMNILPADPQTTQAETTVLQP